MNCNEETFVPPSFTAGVGIVDFDWSNTKSIWAKQKPMLAEEMLVAQVQMAKAVSPSSRYCVYRNAIKALPWFSSVRELLSDPAYDVWFLKFGNSSKPFSPKCDTNYDPPLCSELFHDQVQSPGYPQGDGVCAAPACDCGPVPCGEYLIDHRAGNVSVNNKTLLQWFINDYILNSNGGGNENVSCLYFDDEWSVTGPSECEEHAVSDMGLSPADLVALTSAYLFNMGEMFKEITTAGKFSFQQFYTTPGLQYPMCGGPLISKISCAADFRALCSPGSPAQTRAVFAGFSPGGCSWNSNPPDFEQDLAAFLIWRGDYAFLGYSWMGCVNADVSGAFSKFPELSADYGLPSGLCTETFENSQVFIRNYTHATVTFDCPAWKGTIVMK